MALSDPLKMYGIHSVAFYTRSNSVPIAILKVLSEVTCNFEPEYVDLEGGSLKTPWSSEVAKIGSEITLSGREYEPNTMAMLLGATLTENAAETTGAIDGYANVNGTSILDATTGIASVDVTVGDSADLKEGKYVIVATAAAAVSIYSLSDADFSTGTDESFDDDTLTVETAVDVSSTAAIANFGFTLTKGSGVVALTVGDSAEFYVRKPNSKSFELPFGSSPGNFQEVGVIIFGERQKDGTVPYLEIYKAAVAGFPIGFAEKAFGEWSITIKPNYDSAKNAIGVWRYTVPA